MSVKCLNCNENGHIFKNCKNPILSYGIIGYKMIGGVLKYMLIQRKDTMGYTDFVRGKYKEYNKSGLLSTFLREMTVEEKTRLKTRSFDQIWNDLWVCKESGIYVSEYERAKYKFGKLDLSSLPLDEPSQYHTQEYGFPKGRKNMNEKPIHCAVREFSEETGFCKNDIKIARDIEPLVETFIGSNGVHYTHVYYIAHVISDKVPGVNSKNRKQMEEVKKVGFYDFKEAYELFRDYDTQKKQILCDAHKLLLKKLKIMHRSTACAIIPKNKKTTIQ